MTWDNALQFACGLLIGVLLVPVIIWLADRKRGRR